MWFYVNFHFASERGESKSSFEIRGQALASSSLRDGLKRNLSTAVFRFILIRAPFCVVLLKIYVRRCGNKSEVEFPSKQLESFQVFINSLQKWV